MAISQFPGQFSSQNICSSPKSHSHESQTCKLFCFFSQVHTPSSVVTTRCHYRREEGYKSLSIGGLYCPCRCRTETPHTNPIRKNMGPGSQTGSDIIERPTYPVNRMTDKYNPCRKLHLWVVTVEKADQVVSLFPSFGPVVMSPLGVKAIVDSLIHTI